MSELPQHHRADELAEPTQDITAEHDHSRPPSDADRIAHGIAWAQEKDRAVNHATARVIASQLHEGQDSALYSFASSGAIDKARLGPELAGTYIQDDTPDEVKTWVEQLGLYLEQYEDRPPIHGWHGRHSLDNPPLDDDHCCTGCGAHWSYPHDLECPANPENLSDAPVEIYVASLTDYNNGRLHGVWIDATLEPADIQVAIEFMLRNSYFPDAEEFAIHDDSGFQGLNVGEWTSTEDVSILARGIERHGEAFVRWIEHMDAGLTNVPEVSSQFEDHYHGHYESERAYAEYMLDAGDYNTLIEEARDSLPEHLRDHTRFDIDEYAESLSSEMHIVESADGGIYVFNL